ncbi:hypothetical protein [Alkalibacillus silvisoli]|uniref:Uncharacterized protein n=1 Tax=Alkalibacillus silvisoli TaxID=392823 RepID=A0ABP3K6P7_9BACI
MDHNYIESHPNYQQTNDYSYKLTPGSQEVSIVTWIVVLILIAIPFLNLIACLVMAFGDFNLNLKNFAKATLILMVIGLVVGAFFTGF